jgi:hypothetical protein
MSTNQRLQAGAAMPMLVNPEGLAQIIDVSNAPFARSDLQGVLNRLKFIRERRYPIRGTAI